MGEGKDKVLRRYRGARGRFTSKPYWTSEKIKEALLDFYRKNDNQPFYISDLSRPGYSSILIWLYKKYPKHPLKFFEEHGLSHIIKYRGSKLNWTEEKLVEAVKEAYKKNGNQPVNDRWMNINGFSLPLQHIKKKFNSLGDFAISHNLEEYVVVKRIASYTTEELIQVLTEAYHKNGDQPVNKKWLELNGYHKYVSYIKRRYAHIKDFFDEHDLSHMFIVKGNGGKNRWSEEKIIQVIKESFKENQNKKISYTDLKKRYSRSMFIIISKHYGSFKNFVELNDLTDYVRYRK